MNQQRANKTSIVIISIILYEGLLSLFYASQISTVIASSSFQENQRHPVEDILYNQNLSSYIKELCGDENNVKTLYPQEQHCNASSKVTSGTLNSTIIEGLTFIEMIGPLDPINAAPLVIVASHGGSLRPNTIPDRKSTQGKNIKILKDINTIEIALELKNAIMTNYCKVPYVIINHLHRIKLDANRNINEAAQGNILAKQAWWNFHDYINHAQLQIQQKFGTIITHSSLGGDSIEGIRGLLLDIHGYAGYDWKSKVTNNGSPFIQWGYHLSKHVLDEPTTFYPALDYKNSISNDSASSNDSKGSLVVTGNSTPIECFIRGPQSLGSRFSSLLLKDGKGEVTCGYGLPSHFFPSPKQISSDCFYCEKACSHDHPTRTDANDSSCSYFSGGFNVGAHSYMNWSNRSGGLRFNAVQVELPRCIRFSSSEGEWKVFSHQMSIAISSFLVNIYDDGSDQCRK